MRISVNWLKKFIDVEVSTARLIETLNSIGMLVDSWEERKGDVILELETYANRPDTLGHVGVARELAAALDIPLKEQDWPLIELDETSADNVDIEIYDDDLCPRYCGIVVKGVHVGPSPEWLKEKIEAMGLSPINNVVDISNYILFATAQPIHMFDLSKLKGRKIIVRKAKKEEPFRSLEGDDIVLSPDMLVIADEQKPVALAGVIGGENSAVSDKTREILIECAHFDPISIRKTGKKTGLQTDASYRFERGSDISFPPKAALMAASLLTEFGGKSTKGVVDVYPKPRKKKTVMLRHRRVSELLGVEIKKTFIVETLNKLEFVLTKKQQGVWQVQVPFFRIDIEREADCIEEVARFYGYENIPSQFPPLTAMEPPPDPKERQIRRARQALLRCGFDEVVNYSFADPANEEKFQSGRKAISIRNPISTKASLLRTTLLEGLLETVVWNLNRDADGIHIFEVGNIYFWDNNSCSERLSLGIVTVGWLGTNNWQKERAQTNFFYLKGACESVFSLLRYEPIVCSNGHHPSLEKESALSILLKGKKVGCIGTVRKDICSSFSIKETVWAAELDLDGVFQTQPRPFEYIPVIRYPKVVRDISFIADRNISYQNIKETLEELSIPNLERFELYDRFAGESIPKGKVSLSFRFLYHHPQRTLLAEEVDASQEKIIKALSSKYGFQLREGGEN
ncbi:MAG: phenylalanine--tRNA ligase subunit beta [Candidatus Aminicenantes bacterium]|jgi:phenylalanyl-tRNA synthetase beta chain